MNENWKLLTIAGLNRVRFAHCNSLPVERLVNSPVRQVASRTEQEIVVINVAPVQPVLLSNLMIDAGQILIAVRRRGLRCDVVLSKIGKRNELIQKIRGRRTETRLRNDIPWKRVVG